MDPGLRRAIWQRAGNRCEYCHLPSELDVLPFQIDHVRALKHGGQTTADNLALSCLACNAYKGSNISGVDPVSGSMVGLFDPRREAWKENFRWNGARLAGLNPTARATIEVLRINAPRRVEHRRLLIELGLFDG